jgi:hypothetical protein
MKRLKKCTCCGCPAGNWEQWHKKDTGFGICRECADWIAERTMHGKPDLRSNPLNFSEIYGLPGTHLEPRYYRYFERNVAIVAEFPDTAQGTIDANTFMAKFPNHGVLTVTDGRVIIANMDDLGDSSEAAAVVSAA